MVWFVTCKVLINNFVNIHFHSIQKSIENRELCTNDALMILSQNDGHNFTIYEKQGLLQISTFNIVLCSRPPDECLFDCLHVIVMKFREKTNDSQKINQLKEWTSLINKIVLVVAWVKHDCFYLELFGFETDGVVEGAG